MSGTITFTSGTNTVRSEWCPRGRHHMRTACINTATRYTAKAAVVVGRADAELHG